MPSAHCIHQGQLFKIVPVKDLRNLGIIFPFPATDEHYLKKPTHYLSHLIGHESQGSLLSLLKKRGLANELSAGSSRSAADFELFKISIKLTDQAAGGSSIVSLFTHHELGLLTLFTFACRSLRGG